MGRPCAALETSDAAALHGSQSHGAGDLCCPMHVYRSWELTWPGAALTVSTTASPPSFAASLNPTFGCVELTLPALIVCLENYSSQQSGRALQQRV